MNPLEYTLNAPGANGPPLELQLVASGQVLKFVFTFGALPKGLWRADLPTALIEELAPMEQRLRSPVRTAVIPNDLPMPTAVIASVVTDDHKTALQEWSQAVLRAFRNLSMAHGIEMPSAIITRQSASQSELSSSPPIS